MKLLRNLIDRFRAGIAHEREIIVTWSFRPATNDNDNLSPRARAFHRVDRQAS
jgi:hypothetical protein